MNDFTRTDRQLPPKNTPIEWIAPDGSIVKGKYAGGIIWLLEGSSVYIYYTPEFWRLSEGA